MKHTKIQIYSTNLEGVDYLSLVFYADSHMMHKTWIFIIVEALLMYSSKPDAIALLHKS